MHSQKNHAQYLVPGLERGLRVLQLFSKKRSMLSLAEIARQLGVSRSSAFRLVYTLEYLGFIQQLENSKKYELGARILDLGFGYLSGLDLIESTRIPLEKLGRDLRVSTHLVILDDRDVIYLARYAANHHIISNVHVGARFPAYATAHGQVLLSDKSDEKIADLYRGETLKAYTDQTPVSLADLRSRIAAAKKQGYIISWGYFEKSLASIAAPLHDNSGKIIAAINITCPISQFTREEFESDILKAIRESADSISRTLGYQRPSA